MTGGMKLKLSTAIAIQVGGWVSGWVGKKEEEEKMTLRMLIHLPTHTGGSPRQGSCLYQ